MSPNMSHELMGLIVLSAIAIIVFLPIFMFRCYHNRFMQNQTRALDVEQPNHATRLFARFRAEVMRRQSSIATTPPRPNTAEEEAASIVTKVAYKDIKTTEEADSDDCCAICIEGFEEDEICGVLDRCGHCFHKICIDQWLGIKSRCPLCRCLVRVVSENNNS
ncbi:RING-H2 finger protein ATL64-like [Cucurbita pepo subsp. pepo]|uniref:RING-H2 finger protein ATL64-like n=1 Tax=Cucurbita pepo subsp. pepo TaxID=3664 RepID=UPI000C9D5CDD|nr:RING-H2 finger protein ATL64-like [Cucurbita pepo subsp. pepo]